MKVLHLIDSAGLYGAEKMLLSLILEQKKLGIQSAILSVGNPEILEKPIEKEALKCGIDCFPWRMKDGLNLNGAYQIVKWAVANNYEIAHSHGYKFNILLALIPSGFLKIKTVTTIHGYISTSGLSKINVYGIVDRFLIKRFDHIVLVNKKMLKDKFITRISNTKVTYIPNGLSELENTKNIKPDIQNFISANDFVFCALGRLSPEKCYDLLINSFHLTQQGQTKKHGLLLIGEGPERKQLEDLIKSHGISDSVFMPGYVDQASDVLDKVDCLVISSRTEGLPITLLEAMRANCLIISTRVGGIPEVVDDTSAILIERDNQEQLTNAMKQASNCEKPTKYTLSAHTLFKKNYTAKQMAMNYQDVYQHILSS